MDRLIKRIEEVQKKLETWRRHALRETPTRTIVIDPLLDALGWDVRDPDEVQLEYPTVDHKSVDYALKLNEKPALLVEAKALDDPLNDVKAITQVVGYAANDGIVWCVLTNGVRWKLYRSVEKCQAPDKLMFEVDLDPQTPSAPTPAKLAEQMWRFSREEMAKGTLDELGERAFTDSKVKKALDAIMLDPPRPFLNIVRAAMGDKGMKPYKIKDSIRRVWKDLNSVSRTSGDVYDEPGPVAGKRPPKPARPGRRGKASAKDYSEDHHISGKDREVIELYRELDRFCLSLSPGVVKEYRKHYVSYVINGKGFCRVHLLKRGGLLVYLWLKYKLLNNPPSFARDVSLEHWYGSDVEMRITTMVELKEALPWVKMSWQKRS
jgi:predicted transport protein